MNTNYPEVNLDLQGVAKRIYYSLLYRSTFYNFLNDRYIGELRQTGVPMIEVLKSDDITVNVRQTKEIQNRLNPSLMEYTGIKVDLTELAMDYSIRIPLLVAGSDITNTLEDAMEKKDQAVAKAIDTYGYGVLANQVILEEAWSPATQEDYIIALNGLRARLFNNNVFDDYRLGLSATEYGKYVSAITSVLKYETISGVEGVDRGTIAVAYGVGAFQINDEMLDGVKGYFFNPIAVVGDAFFDTFSQFNSPQGFPGYYVLEGNIMFGAKVVETNAIIALKETISG